MIRLVLLLSCVLFSFFSLKSQNVFNPADPIVRYDSTKPLASVENPNPAKTGLQKWVSVATNSISNGFGAWDASSYKAYYINVGGARLALRLKFPKSYGNPDSVNKKYPVMLFFHGAGEPGCPANGGIYNNEKQLLHGGELFMKRVDNNEFDGFLMYPQVVVANCSSSWPTTSDVAVFAFLDSLIKYAKADIDRLFIDGLSDGGRNTWRIARTFPMRVSSIAPSAMSAMTTALTTMVHIPVWFASGGKDSNPSPAQAQETLNAFNNLGGNIRYTLYPELGHGVWNDHWSEPDFVPYLNETHKANPLIFFMHNEWCSGPAISAKMGLTPGFNSYEWSKDNVVIARRLNGVNTIVNAAAVASFAGNEITIKQYGTYRARFRRTATGAWSDWSPKPIVIKIKTITNPLPIQVVGLKSNVLPALDGSTTVPLTLAPGFTNYRWYRASDNVLLNSQQLYNPGAGTFKAKYDEKFGCGSNYSANFTVVNANGTPKPAPAATLIASPVSQTSIALSWVDNPSPPSQETNYEVYRGLKSAGPYQLINITPANAVSYTDTLLTAGTNYYYVVRAVNNTGASVASNEAVVKTLVDNVPPQAPTNVQYAGSTTTSVSLRWKASTDNLNVKRYDIYVNGVKNYSATGTSFTVNNLDSLKWYAFTVKAVDGAGNSSAPSAQVMGYTHRAGLNFKYYNGTFNNLPDFNSLVPAKIGITKEVNALSSIRTQADGYAALWEGYIYIPQTALYTFATYSDEGSRVYIDMPYTAAATPLVENDGVHPPAIAFNLISLVKGYHRIAVSYFERSGSETMGLYWTNSLGMPQEEISGNFFTSANIDGIPPLVAPSELTAIASGYNKIALKWKDNSDDETGFEITRAPGTGGSFVPVGRVAANKLAFTDSALSSATTYYYQVRAVGATSESPYTDTATETTLAAPGTPVAPSALTAENSLPTKISLSWIDNANNETNIQVWRSADAQASFQLLATLPPNANGYTDAAVTAYAQYYYYVNGINLAGNGAASDTLPVIAGNDPPVIGNINNMFVKIDATASQDFTVADAGDVVTIGIDNKPSFINLQKLSGNNYRITLTPGTDNIGWYNLAMKAVDSKKAVTTRNFRISVADKNTRSVYVNFGAAGKTAPAPWNNWLGARGANNTIGSLRDENNVATTFGVTTITAWSGTTNLGHITGDDSGAFPDSVLQSGLADNGAAKQIRISGLNPAMRYNLVFAGSQNEGLNALTEFITGTQRDTLNARYNTNQTANLNGLVPNASGQIDVTINRIGGSLITYLNGMAIEEYAPAITLLNPLKLFAETVDRTRIFLSWSDRTNNENTPDGYLLIRATDSLFTQNVVNTNLQRNTTAYQVTGLAPNTKYWFRVRAKAGAVFSDFSNRAKAITPSSVVYVNFNANVVNAAAPWNNTVAQPTSPTTFSNLVNQANVNSGLSLRIEQIFNGEFSAGMNTGNNSGVVPDAVLQSDYWIDKTQLAQMRLSGLNQTRRYRIGFIGSSGPQGWYKDNYTATYTINGKTVYLNSWSNSTKVVYIKDVVPDEGGEILLNFSTTADAAFGFNAGVIVEDYNDPDAPLNPGNTLMVNDITPIGFAIDSLSRNRMYPNPFNDFITVEYNNTNRSAKVSAFIYDVAGRLVFHQDYSNLVPGFNQLRVNAGGLKTGSKMFTVVFAANGKVLLAKKMIRK